jgi:DnaJ-class molecular chaperone
MKTGTLCPRCGGSGEIADPDNKFIVFIECPMCKGKKIKEDVKNNS